MVRRFLILLVCVIIGLLMLLIAAESSVAKSATADRPNILCIMVDDLGKEWISCYGAEGIRIPNIDALAAGGMMFHNAYSMPS